MNNKIFIILSFIIIGTNLKCQYFPKDSLYGSVKKIREKVVFLTEIENPQLLYYDDYGHSGFMGPESTINRFRDTWFNSNVCYYINYERTFNRKRKIIKDIWYGKKDDFMNSYRTIYNKNDKILSEIDSTNYSLKNTNYYYDKDNITIISQRSDFDSFSHTFKNYKNGKLKTLKRFYQDGGLYEFKFIYNKNNKYIYRIHVAPNIEEETEEISTPNIYKDIINKYDKKNRLIKHQKYELNEDNKGYKNIVLTDQIEYKYNDKDNKPTRIKSTYRTGMESFDHYVYDKEGRISNFFCCEEEISKAEIIKKYEYLDNELTKTEYTEEGKNYIISFKYKYDENKNWIEIIKNVDGKDLYKWIREIQYY